MTVETPTPRRILVLGATGSVGRLVVREAQQAGHDVVALVRDEKRAARLLPTGVTLVRGDVAAPAGLAEALDGVDAIVATLGGDAQRVDFGGMANVLTELGSRRVHIVLMSVIGAANHDAGMGLIDWKRRGERLVRASGNTFTIVRPGWFDMNRDDQQALHFVQGERRWSGSPADGVIGRDQIARTLVAAITSCAAIGKTFDLVAERGPAQADLEPLFAALEPDVDGVLDASWDPDNMPLDAEPESVRRLQAELPIR